ncbi:MOSC domain-containing protein [Halomonas litopenaei]|uniref:MOSC domain-containing protein n=2 Tax=Halomonadaceae TaxID=28256 RepID=A0ABX5J157_9GAMM|nr:MOSC domain-containing protein [Halomonas sp. SYSU XM8]PTL96530.1 MOSC domain-containing protein [Halomonas litopenaei]
MGARMEFSDVRGPYISEPQMLPGFGEKSGIYKVAAAEPQWLSRLGLSNDSQANQVDHGGVDRALCHYCADHYPRWNERYPDAGVVLEAGVLGENIASQGADEREVRIGDVYRIGEALVQVTQPRQPCAKVDARTGQPGLARAFMQEARMGWLYRVLEEGWIAPGPVIEVVERGDERWSVEACWRVLEDRRAPLDTMAELHGVEALAQHWKDQLVRRMDYWRGRA